MKREAKASLFYYCLFIMIILFLFPILGALIGSLSLLIGCLLLIWPQKPIKLGPFSIQGVLCKRLSQAISSALSECKFKPLFQEMTASNRSQNKISGMLDRFIATLLENFSSKMPMAQFVLQGPLGSRLKEETKIEFFKTLPLLEDEAADFLVNEMNITEAVSQFVSINESALNKAFLSMIWGNLKFILICGGLSGFIIGVLLLPIFYLLT